MHQYVSAQLKAVDEGLALLEAVVTSPLGLYSDIRMLRGTSSVQDRTKEIDRLSYKDLSRNPAALALEALRSVEDAIRTIEAMDSVNPPPLDKAWIQQARRVFARIDQRVSSELRKDMISRIKGLYVIIDPEATNGRPVLQVAEAALKGGAKVIQLRSKKQDKGDVLPVARQMQKLCESHGGIFFVNDHADMAAACGAHGLHVGQHDLPIEEARRLLKSTQLVGTSNALVQEALDAQSKGADYIAVGAIYPTNTKGNTRPAGLETLRKVKASVAVPVVAIGGINESNVVEVVKAGADCVCVVSAVCSAKDPEDAARRLVARMSA